MTHVCDTIRQVCKETLEIQKLLANLKDEYQNKTTNLEFISEVIWTLRKGSDFIDALRKEMDKACEQYEAQACRVLLATGEKNYKGTCATISPNPGIALDVPSSPRDEGYDEFIKRLPPKAVRPHYPTLMEMATEELGRGSDCPLGVPKAKLAHTVSKCRVTSKKEF